MGSEYLFAHGNELHSTNALSPDSVERSTGEVGERKLAVWRPGSKTADYPRFLDLQGVRSGRLVGEVRLES